MISYKHLKSAYNASPRWVQSCYSAIPFSWRAGRSYHRHARLIRRSEFADEEEIRLYQLQSLQKLLSHAKHNVPYYSFLDDMPVPKCESEIDACLASWPIVEKSTLQADAGRFKAVKGVQEPVYTDNTGGSSGTPFEFLKSNTLYPIELAHMMAQWKRVGYSPADRKLTLRGRTFVQQSPGDRWAYNPIYNELIISAYHLDHETVAQALRRVRRFAPRYIHGYPTAIVRFLRVVSELGEQMPPGIEAVLCGSEPVYDFQRKFIQDCLRCRVYSWYGQSECVLLAGECEHSDEYHSFPTYGYLELVDNEGNRITEPNVEGNIVGTSLNNYAMPFIRYNTGDRGVYSDRSSCECGRSHARLKAVTGRQQDFVYTYSGTPVPVTALVFGQHFNAFRRISAIQLLQRERGRVSVRIVAAHGFSECDEAELRRKMEQAVDGGLRLSFDYRETIPTNNAGKTPMVVQKLQPASHTHGTKYPATSVEVNR